MVLSLGLFCAVGCNKPAAKPKESKPAVTEQKEGEKPAAGAETPAEKPAEKPAENK